VAIKGLARAIGASSAGGRDEELLLQRFKTAAATANFALDVAVRHTPANAHDHDRAPLALNFDVAGTAALLDRECESV
jgi:hypothetical protein